MTSPMQRRSWLLRMSWRVARVAPTLAVALTLGALGVQPTQAGTYKVLYYFTNQVGNPYGAIRQKNGTIYGYAPGGNTDCPYTTSCGIVFELDKTGKVAVLYSFAGGSDGAGPSGNLIEDQKGNFYGTTIYGGGGPCKVEQTVVGCGTVFKLSAPKEKGGAWAETVLYSFEASDGAWPYAGLARDAVGNLYGATTFGGGRGTDCGSYGCGTVFRLDAAHRETVLYRFSDGTDGGRPMGGLVLDDAGNLYGVANSGGNPQGCGGGCGVVFKVGKSGKETVLHSFTGTNGDGQQPEGVTLVRDSAGNLYGTTPYGGTPVNGLTFGTVFKVSAKGKETVLYSFQGFLDGGYPFMGLLRDAKGNLYGIADRFGKFQYGTFFEVRAAAKFATLHSFNQLDGYSTGSPLFMDATGALYGVLGDGGDYQDFCQGYGCGTVFKFTPQLNDGR
jgi:uncharacterized repeat protein (TIGR03803 family)